MSEKADVAEHTSVELQTLDARGSIVAVSDPKQLPEVLERARGLKEEYMAHMREAEQKKSKLKEMCANLGFRWLFENTFDVYVRIKVFPYKYPFTTGVVTGVKRSCNFFSQNSFDFWAPYKEGDVPLLSVVLYDKQRVKDHTLGQCVINALQLCENKDQVVTLDGILIKEATANKPDHFAGDVRLEGKFDGQRFYFKVRSLSNLVHKHALKKSAASSRLVYVASIVVVLYLGIGTAFFMAVQEWTFIQSLFFCILTLTTVGYQASFDHDTALIRDSPGKMWFLIIYALVGISMIAAALGIVGGSLIENISHAPDVFRDEDEKELNEVDGRKALAAVAGRSCVGRISACGKATPISVWLFAFMVLLGTLFFGLVPDAATPVGETNWTVLQALYFSVISLATIGYGDLYIRTERGMWFGVFWITFGTLITAKCVGNLLNLYFDHRGKKLRQEILSHAFRTEADIAAFDEDGDGIVSEVEWTAKMLVKLKLVSQDHLDGIHKQFKLMDVNHTGDIDMEEIRKLFKLGAYMDPNYVPPAKKGNALPTKTG